MNKNYIYFVVGLTEQIRVIDEETEHFDAEDFQCIPELSTMDQVYRYCDPQAASSDGYRTFKTTNELAFQVFSEMKVPMNPLR